MDYFEAIQSVLDVIDKRIIENIKVKELACHINYSTYHFCRIFTGLIGTPVMSYVSRRKLEYALYDLSQGKKVIDIAMDYGFETHAGFTKAFKKYFGYTPSLYRMRVQIKPPDKATIKSAKLKHGGIIMQVQIKKIDSFTIAGVISRHSLPYVKRGADIPAFWSTISMDYGKNLTRAYNAFNPTKHGEYSICFDIDENSDDFTYLLGVSFDSHADEAKVEKDMKKVEVSGGLYAVFTTPETPNEQYAESITNTWNDILTRWLPESLYDFDDTRLDFEAYDERDHAWLHDGKCQMDIYIPIRERK